MYVAVEDFRTLVDTMNYPVRGKTEWTKTTYTTQTGLHYLHDDTSTVRAQRHLRNRVSSRKTYQGVETVYSYDPHGNVAWVYQNLPGLGGNFIGYDYDLISNRVKQVLYDEQHGDQFYQRYGYDEDGRVTTVESSRDSVIWDRDAEYSYFLHGPLMRIELGEDRLQGLDYTHTIHGWLKAINHPALSIDTTLDPGHDNGMERTAPDVFGMILNYYEGDYLRSYNSGADQSPFNSKTVGSSTEQAYQLTSRNLYNGNISGWSLRTTPVGTPSIPAGQTAPALLTHESLVGYSFRYDVLNRLRTSSFSYYSQGSTSAWNNMGTADYYMSLAYDPNGNIDSMTRHGYAKPGGNVAMDKLTYSYPTTPGAENNRLRHVKDSESAGYYSNDIDDEPDDNYLYDPSGNLIYDQSEGTLIRWNAQGKVTQVRKITATVKKDLIYIYDGAGERIAKKELDYLASGDSSWVTYYVRDAVEKVIAVYRQKYHYDSTEILCPPGVPGSGSDSDADGFDETPPNICDNCNSTESPSLPPEYSRRNPWQEDYDGDGIGDACDPCPFGPGDECGTPLSDTAVVRMSKWKPSGFAVLAEWHIYGSSIQGRVGIWKPEKNRDTSLVSDTIFTRILTMKEYELKDHLGNVTVVISDLKIATTGGGAPFGVDVKSFSHYYPFGMLQPGAFGSNREYRFGYNGKESDNDWKGEGNVYDYGFRVYDPRIAKFLSVDPLAPEYPWYTPYQFAGNKPISKIDRDGLEEAEPPSYSSSMFGAFTDIMPTRIAVYYYGTAYPGWEAGPHYIEGEYYTLVPYYIPYGDGGRKMVYVEAMRRVDGPEYFRSEWVIRPDSYVSFLRNEKYYSDHGGLNNLYTDGIAKEIAGVLRGDASMALEGAKENAIHQMSSIEFWAFMVMSAHLSMDILKKIPQSPNVANSSRGLSGEAPPTEPMGPHTIFRRNSSTGQVNHYTTRTPQTNPRNPNAWEITKRFDGEGAGHFNKSTQQNVPTPHVHDPTANGGVRTPEPWEKPRGY
jgi:RHS repeat-associated protein